MGILQAKHLMDVSKKNLDGAYDQLEEHIFESTGGWTFSSHLSSFSLDSQYTFGMDIFCLEFIFVSCTTNNIISITIH